MESENIVKKQFIAARAVIVDNGKVMLIKEASNYEGGTNHGKYDFPGGKIKVGEDIFSALIRETKEEAGVDILVQAPFFVTEWNPVINGERIQIIGVFFKSKLAYHGEVRLGPDHDEYKWVDKSNYDSLPLIEATRKALEEYYSL
jgi:8-oxo-dGTP diphosphatase